MSWMSPMNRATEVRARIVALEDRLVGAHDRLQSGLPAGPLQRANQNAASFLMGSRRHRKLTRFCVYFCRTGRSSSGNWSRLVDEVADDPWMNVRPLRVVLETWPPVNCPRATS